ncbi:MAG: glycosyltransferase family 39 protein [Pirellulales bacterium]|nr:glycosyltransferase family 39 protein [Pirellulales bacterium]
MRDYLALTLVALLATTLMFWQLGRRYLWQDEAATAVLAERMFEYGKPLGYDGRNLITMDVNLSSDRAALEKILDQPDAMVQYFGQRGDYKADTTWIGQPWGQFVLAGSSLAALGHGTWQARLPFALCGMLAVVVLYLFTRRCFDDPLLALLAAFLLLANVYWVLHMRQCRYYAPSSLFLLLTIVAYLRWQDARRFGAAIFVAAAWLWFQCDYGTVWPVLGVLAADALVERRRSIVQSVTVFAVVGLSLLPWVVYYELLWRMKETPVGALHRVMGSLFYFNQYLFPLVLLPLAAWCLWRSRGSLRADQRQILVVSLLVLVSLLVWVPIVTPAPHHRYFVVTTPLACLLLAYVAVWLAGKLSGGTEFNRRRTAFAAALALLVAAPPWFSNIPLAVYPSELWPVKSVGTWLRAEYAVLYRDLSGQVRDPNAEIVALLAPRLGPEDEVLINYEDIPLMFYLPNRVRGGVLAFRVEDRNSPPPRFAVLNNSVVLHYSGELQRQTYRQMLERHRWNVVPREIPALPSSNCPDPGLHPAQWVADESLTILELAPEDRAKPRQSGNSS